MKAVTARQLTGLETLFKALADTTRLRILALLGAGEVCVCDIYETLRIPQPKASRHLAYLRAAGLVEARKEGLWVHYRLADPADPVARTILDATRHCLTHLEAIGRDQERLARRRGEDADESPDRGGQAPALSCCGAVSPVRLILKAARREA
jgi:ArsR family transcriptional regulator